jgi:hypothetical protein
MNARFRSFSQSKVKLIMVKIAVAATLASVAVAQDPANGWIAYAVGEAPAGTGRITSLEMTWKVSSSPSRGSAFYSPWFGMDPSDNLNLIQPVNPWGGSSWSMYTEYFQWSPEHNSNSEQERVESGQTLHGALTYHPQFGGYTLNQTIVETGKSSSQFVKDQNGKNYTLPYVVYEKVFPCGDYPPDGKVDFKIVKAECDNVDCMAGIKWSPKVKEDHCNFKANIVSSSEISITWDTSMASKYDDFTAQQLHDLNYNGWATQLNIPRPKTTFKIAAPTTKVAATSPDVCSPCYEKPPACTGSETSVQITGVTGSFCSPLCYQNQCPKGDGSFTATPSCVLETQGSSKPTQCALICTPGDDAACPAGASCQSIQGEGICTYPTRR